MYMEYVAADNRIITDHLSAADDRHLDDFAFYGPDMTQDAWQLKGGRLMLQEDIVFKRPAP